MNKKPIGRELVERLQDLIRQLEASEEVVAPASREVCLMNYHTAEFDISLREYIDRATMTLSCFMDSCRDYRHTADEDWYQAMREGANKVVTAFENLLEIADGLPNKQPHQEFLIGATKKTKA